MGNFDVTTPLGTDFISLGDDNIRELKTAVREALRGGVAEGTEAVFPGSAPSTAPVYRYRGLKGTTGARPTAGQYGLYFNETLNSIQRDNGSSWVDVGTHIPAGTKMVFYQASPPTGWTAVAVNDKFLRVVTSGGTGGTTGGSVAASTSLAHTHTVASHTHDLANHTHTVPFGGWTGATNSAAGTIKISGGSETHATADNTSGVPSSNTSGATSPSTDSQLGAFAYADVVIATKD